jgi:hypothetical protein
MIKNNYDFSNFIKIFNFKEEINFKNILNFHIKLILNEVKNHDNLGLYSFYCCNLINIDEANILINNILKNIFYGTSIGTIDHPYFQKLEYFFISYKTNFDLNIFYKEKNNIYYDKEIKFLDIEKIYKNEEEFRDLRNLRIKFHLKKNLDFIELPEYKYDLYLFDINSIEKLYFLYEMNKIDYENFMLKKNEILIKYK